MQAAQLPAVHALAVIVCSKTTSNTPRAAYQPNRPLPCRHRQHGTNDCTVYLSDANRTSHDHNNTQRGIPAFECGRAEIVLPSRPVMSSAVVTTCLK
jgi:hypothetical protein